MRTCAYLLLLPVCAHAEPAPLRSEGVATTADGRVAYREVHWQQGPDEGAQRWVEYRCGSGQPFARKQLPATGRPAARGYTLQDRRSGQAATLDVSATAVQVQWREAGDAAPVQARVALPADAVIDAGFDAAVRQHWDTLLRGQPVTLSFLVPGRQRFYPLKVQYRGALQWQGQPAQSFAVRLDAWYGAVAPGLSLVYANADRRLLEFNGTSNLRDGKGRYPQVRVTFRNPPVPASRSQWQREQELPLVASCGVTAK
ncbi:MULTISPECIES: hypothetical protein [Stenotrophomonas]|uniref:hypothetical protein n=1 Tax=Stenotrophomonas TaxID=40323 RepID=UPI000D540C2C|nr:MULTISPECIES: hypothetical protein [Stenotrophomonas]AWH21593.1 hypothetical protein C1933_10395 [Stenotrophomonas sp. ZAC14D2_NAIMI4_6]